MNFSKSKWLAYTFLVGLIPILTRLLTWAATSPGRVAAFSMPDLFTLGLVLHISVINELEHLPIKEREWRTMQNGLSIVFIVLYSVLYTVAIIGERNTHLIDARSLQLASIILVITSVSVGVTVFHRLAKGN
jgi:NADH:ubiquinone oxidoreductase subunit 4 (subunit M)